MPNWRTLWWLPLVPAALALAIWFVTRSGGPFDAADTMRAEMSELQTAVARNREAAARIGAMADSLRQTIRPPQGGTAVVDSPQTRVDPPPPTIVRTARRYDLEDR